ncbi:GTPase-associated system all-helical protein GASH [Corallococcus sp. AB038B]|uniref:GTPase-associated system all-helical protein GASH n=1 Tax=Corallococcus sp. AB038B TaxID=2316718 RepID=UPI000EBC7B0A|nr:GTPase-associated system all-helical protein GASH [Corallococcus sp. AB038B]RKI04417.1 hypothetical protein D7Y04_05685 [Corallococcus sp. AB038B]
MASNQILLQFLNAGLINVGGDDAKLERLRETAADLAAELKRAPAKAASFALIAFDPEAPADDPVIKEASAALQSRWATYINTFSGTPVAVLRALLLDALVRTASEDEKIGVAFVASARNVLPFTEAGNERAIWIDVVTDIERRVDSRAEAEWATPETINVSAMAFQSPDAVKIATSQVSIDKLTLAKKLEAAAGPNNPTQATGGNPYWPNNNGQHWLAEFGTRMADVLIEALGAVVKSSQFEPIDLSPPLKGLAQAVSAHVDGTLRAVSGATAGLQRRTNLLWWKEALYSPSARTSYRSMSISTAAALMAFDMHRQVPTLSPASVAAFLYEAVLSLPSSDTNIKRPISEHLTDVLNAEELSPLRQAASEMVPKHGGRGPVLGLIGQGAGRALPEARAFRDRIGVPASAALTAPEWATWIFRELQATRAANEGAEARKRGRKT